MPCGWCRAVWKREAPRRRGFGQFAFAFRL
jgi:hypothetical protein